MGKRVVILGRPNVGKSTLFNRLVGRQISIVHESPGTTRDWHEEIVIFDHFHFSVTDTAGIGWGKMCPDWIKQIEQTILHQMIKILRRIDLIFFVIDGKQGVTTNDEHLARFARSYKKPTILIINKCDGSLPSYMKSIQDSHSLGIEKIISISAKFGDGFGELYSWLRRYVEIHSKTVDTNKLYQTSQPIRIVIAGRPNVGKSTLANALAGEDRVIVDSRPGTTFDTIPIPVTHSNSKLLIIDSAGLAPRGWKEDCVRQASNKAAVEAICYAQAVILVLDALDSLNKQDLTLASLIEREGRILVIALNKWDKVDLRMGPTLLSSFQSCAKNACSQIPQIPIIPVSALKLENTSKLLETVLQLQEVWNKQINTSRLNQWLDSLKDCPALAISRSSGIHLKYITQVRTRPPTFHMFTKRNRLAQAIPRSYQRYLEKKLRVSFDFQSIPLRIRIY